MRTKLSSLNPEQVRSLLMAVATQEGVEYTLSRLGITKLRFMRCMRRERQLHCNEHLERELRAMATPDILLALERMDPSKDYWLGRERAPALKEPTA